MKKHKLIVLSHKPERGQEEECWGKVGILRICIVYFTQVSCVRKAEIRNLHTHTGSEQCIQCLLCYSMEKYKDMRETSPPAQALKVHCPEQ